MATITVQVKDKKALNITPEVTLVCRNEGYTVEFEFDEAWKEHTLKTAIFVYNGKPELVPFAGNVCEIPTLYNTELLRIGVFTDNGNLATSTSAKVDCLLSANDLVETELPKPSENIYNRIIEMINAGMVKGEKGDEINAVEFVGTTDKGDNVYLIKTTSGKDYTFVAPKGQQGIQGEKGERGSKIIKTEFVRETENGSYVYLQTFDDGSTNEFIAPKGEKGETGTKVDSFVYTGTNENGDNVYLITYSDGTQYTFISPKGDKGDTGKTGAKIVSTILIGQDENGGNIYEQTFDDGTTQQFTAPKGKDLNIGETYDTAFAGDRGLKLERQVKTLYSFHEEEGDIIVTPIDTAFNERTTADGANVVDGSLAVLEKVEGNSIACKNLFNNLIVENPLTMAPVASAESLKAILKKGQMVVKGFNGTTFNNPNIVSAVIPIKNNTSYVCNGYNKQAILLLDENFVKLGQGGTDRVSVTNDVGAKYAYIYIFNIAQSSTQQTWTLEEALQNLQFEEGTTATEYQPYFAGLKGATFKGIESKDKDGNVISTLEFPEAVPTPLGTTIDFEQKKIINYGVTLVLTGVENWKVDNTFELYGVEADNIVPTVENGATGICTDAELGWGKHLLRIGLNNKRNIKWVGILEKLGYAVSTVDERAESLGKFKAWLAERYASGNPVTIRYVSSELQSETPFTAEQRLVGDNYIVAPQGTETVLGNDTEAENKPTIEYVIKAGA